MFDKDEFNRLSALSIDFDSKYCDYNNRSKIKEHTVIKEHNEIIDGFKTLLLGTCAEHQKYRPDVFTNMHVQYEGLRKYFGIRYDHALSSEKKHLLDKQLESNNLCIYYTNQSHEACSTKKYKSYALKYLGEYNTIKSRLENEKLSNQHETVTQSSLSEFPTIEREISERGLVGAATLLKMSQDAQTPSIAVSHRLLDINDARTASFQIERQNTSIDAEVINRCFRELTVLYRSSQNLDEPQRIQLSSALASLGSLKKDLNETQVSLQRQYTSAQSMLGLFGSIVGTKRSQRDDANTEDNSQYKKSASSSTQGISNK